MQLTFKPSFYNRKQIYKKEVENYKKVTKLGKGLSNYDCKEYLKNSQGNPVDTQWKIFIDKNP